MIRYNPVPILADILGEAAKEKVTRIVLATFRVSFAPNTISIVTCDRCDVKTNE